MEFNLIWIFAHFQQVPSMLFLLLLLLLVTAKGRKEERQIFRFFFIWANKRSKKKQKEKTPLAVTGARPCKRKCVSVRTYLYA